MMLFSKNYSDNSPSRLYYRRAFLSKYFDSFIEPEQKRLIAFLADIYDNSIRIEYDDSFSDDSIGRSDDSQGLLKINENLLLDHDESYSWKLYVFLLKNLLKKTIDLKKKISMIEDESIELSVKRKKKEEYVNDDLEIIILHLLLDELITVQRFCEACGEACIALSKQIFEIDNGISLLVLPEKNESIVDNVDHLELVPKNIQDQQESVGRHR